MTPHVWMGIEAREQISDHNGLEDKKDSEDNHPLVKYAKLFTRNFDLIAERKSARSIHGGRQVGLRRFQLLGAHAVEGPTARAAHICLTASKPKGSATEDSNGKCKQRLLTLVHDVVETNQNGGGEKLG